MVDPVAVRKTVLRMLYEGKASHLGPSMSVVEMLIAIYGSLDLARVRARSPDRSRVIVSKGHCAAATYAVMAHFGLIDLDRLRTYCQDGSALAGHVSHAVERVEHSTGALGHGLSVACGCAIGLRSRGYEGSHVYALVGDGELQEGSVWEALMFARHHRLSRLIPLVDDNRISSITRTAEVIDMRPLRDRFEGFGFRVHEVDGHDVGAITRAIREVQAGSETSVILCETVKGRGVPFAEDEPIWHYRTLGEDDYRAALAHLEGMEGEA
ncbi:MAG: transketolase [Planctomycetes bacterium]|nr:transketolase [Planctomycetota bacterium]